MDEYPAGKFWCPRCVMKTDFVIAYGASHTEPDAPLECWKCGYIHHKIRHELEDDGVTHRKSPKVSPAIPKWMRHDARVLLKREFQESAERSGFARENFTMPGRRRK